MEFEWDPEKSRQNERKHGVSFHEAIEVFGADADAIELFDELRSDFEDRFITIGPIHDGLVMVVWAERDDDVVRVISARWATPREQVLYREHMEQYR